MKDFCYVIVFTENGAKFVTEVNNADKTCKWETDKTPYKFASKQSAQNVATGLTLNFNFAVAVASTYEVTSQPYNYSHGHFEWVKND